MLLLLIDFSAHGIPQNLPTLRNLSIECLTQNAISNIHPMDDGIICYRKVFLQKESCLSRSGENSQGREVVLHFLHINGYKVGKKGMGKLE